MVTHANTDQLTKILAHPLTSDSYKTVAMGRLKEMGKK